MVLEVKPVCRECGWSKFDEKGRCVNCETYSPEAADKIKNEEYEAKRKEGKL